MPSIQVTVVDQIEDEMAIETEYDLDQLRLMSMSSEQSFMEKDQDVVPELPTSRVKHADDDDWEVSAKSKRHMLRLKEAKIQRLRAKHWNDVQSRKTKPMANSTAEGRDNVEEPREHPRGYHRPKDTLGELPEKPDQDQHQLPDTPKSLFSPSTMSDSESLKEEERQQKTERYQRMINDPYAFSAYAEDDDVIPQVVVVDNKSSKSGAPNTNDAEEDDESAVVENSPSEDSWDMLNKYDENANAEQNNDTATSKSPSVYQPTNEKALTKSKDEIDLAASGDELMGIGFVKDENMAPKSDDKNNAVLDRHGTAEMYDFGEEPQPSFGNVWCEPRNNELQAVKTTETKETTETEEVSEGQVDPEEQVESVPAKDTNAKEQVSPSTNDFPHQSVLELIMKRAEMRQNSKKQAGEAATSEKEPPKGESSEPSVVEGSTTKIKEEALHEEVSSTTKVDHESFKGPESGTESSKALLDNAFHMIARLQKENAEKDDRLRSSDLYVQSLEKKLFEEKSAMEEERKRRANMDSDQVSALKDKVTDTMNKLNCEEGKSKALQQLANDLKEELRIEKFKVGKNQEENITTKAHLEREQSQVSQLQNDLAARDKTLEDFKSRVQELKEQLALANKRASQEESRAIELRAALSEAESRLEKTELKLIHTNTELKTFLDVQNASDEIKRNEEIMEKLKQSIESRQQLVDEEEVKKQEILSKQLENASLAEDHRASAKKVEESLEKYFQLIRKEKDEVNRLKQLGKERQEQIANETTLVKELEATIARKNAMLDLEKVKQQALESCIAQKGRLLDIETSKMREHKTICAERMRQIEEEKETIRLAIQEKEELLCSEKAAIEYLQKAIQTKKALREERKAWEKAVTDGYGIEPKKRGSGIWADYREAEEQKVILSELGKLRSSQR